MRIVVLSRAEHLYTTRRLLEEGQAGGHRVEIVDTLGCTLGLNPRQNTVSYNSEELRAVDVVIPRLATQYLEYGIAVVKQFQLLGVCVINDAESILLAGNKIASLQVLWQKNIPIPQTVLLQSKDNLATTVEKLGGFPIIVKLLHGAQGIGVMLADNLAVLQSILESFWSVWQHVIMQEYIQQSNGQDLRVLVIAGQAVAAMRRHGQPGEFRSNIHLGGWGEPISPSASLKRLAIRAARALGLSVAGVDLLESARGPLVLEVNACPGFEELEKCTSINIARQIILHCERRAINTNNER